MGWPTPGCGSTTTRSPTTTAPWNSTPASSRATSYGRRRGSALGDLKAAEADYTRALDTGSAPVRVYFLRSDIRKRLKDTAGADADRAEGLRRQPRDELSWVARAEHRLATPADALTDVEEVL